ncbi:CHAD domain-containing protein [Paraburkholderia phytofirmans]|uniref:CHAD domain-containing protein n=1 Tax=Paraburkholderia phytofirmans TaxID=261302 RepID=UPI0038BD42C3
MNSTPDTRDPASAPAPAQERNADNPGKRGGTIAPDMSPAVAFSTLATPMAAQVAQRIGSLCVSADAESPHKLRVVLRRLRSLWWAYDPLIDRSQARWQRREFKALADSAGQTRDWDILKHLLAEDVSTAHSFAALLERLDLLRGNALLRSRATIADSNAEAMLTQRIASVIHQLDACSFDEPLAVFATNRIATAKQSLRKRLKRALGNPHTGYAELHDVRIAGKKVRYLLEFFAPLLDSGNEISVVELTQLQDELGKLNDIVSSEALLLAHADRLGEPGVVDDAIAYLRHRKGQHMQRADAELRALSDRLALARRGAGMN